MYNDAIFVACMYLNIIVMLHIDNFLGFFLSLYNIISDGSGYHYPLDRYFFNRATQKNVVETRKLKRSNYYIPINKK